MDYKEKYENGVECIQEILGGAGDSIRTSILRKRLQPFFPELKEKESEDEGIKKAIIRILKGETCYVSKEDTDKYVTWLEKQGKHNTVEWSEEDEKIKESIKKVLANTNFNKLDIKYSFYEMISWLEKQNKQIPSRETILAIWELGNDWKELTNGSISTEYGTQLEYIQKHWQESSYYDNIMGGGDQ